MAGARRRPWSGRGACRCAGGPRRHVHACAARHSVRADCGRPVEDRSKPGRTFRSLTEGSVRWGTNRAAWCHTSLGAQYRGTRRGRHDESAKGCLRTGAQRATGVVVGRGGDARTAVVCDPCGSAFGRRDRRRVSGISVGARAYHRH